MPNLGTDVSVTDVLMEAHYIVRSAAEPWSAGDSVKVGISRAARCLGLTYRRARTLWYCRQCAILAEEMDRLRLKHLELLQIKKRRLQVEIEKLDAKFSHANEDMRAELVRRLGGQYGQNAAQGGGAGAQIHGGDAGADGRLDQSAPVAGHHEGGVG